MKLRNFFFLLLIILTLPVWAKFNYSKDNLNIISDKAFSNLAKKTIEATGNVVVTYKDSAIYAQKVSIDFKTGRVDARGNIRYISSKVTLYGSHITYNFKTAKFSVYNAKLLSENFIVIGSKLSKVSRGVYVGENAEYTTCRDCPESWTIYGKKIHITIGNYIRLWDIYIKVKGVVMMYLPYIIVPIKKERESGLLFPSFSFNLEEGFHYQQPFYFAFNRTSDLTFSPSVWTKRGFGHHTQYRKVLNHENWYELETLQLWDRIYRQGKSDNESTGSHDFRFTYNYEHHFNDQKTFNHYFYLSYLHDLDIYNDFPKHINRRNPGNEPGVDGFLSFRKDLFDINLETYWKQNLLYDKSEQYDDRYVQILPKVSFDLIPITLLENKGPLIKRVDFGLQADITHFKQNHFSEEKFIRNATRFHTVPYVRWLWNYLGPVKFQSIFSLDFQDYHFSRQEEKRFRKSALVGINQVSVELEKVFGLAYQDEVFIETAKKKKEDGVWKELIGDLPNLQKRGDKKIIKKNAYRHLQEFKIQHSFLSREDYSGNASFAQQIRENDGYFDYIDRFYSQRRFSTQAQERKVLPTESIELQWNNSLIAKKARYKKPDPKGNLIDNYEYKKISYFNLSQGYSFMEKGELARLQTEAGIELDNVGFTFHGLYFFDHKYPVIDAKLYHTFSKGDVTLTYFSDELPQEEERYLILYLGYNLNDLWRFGLSYDYDLLQSRSNQSTYTIDYRPVNNCWRLEFSYERDLVDDRYSFNFLINFNQNKFRTIY